MNEEPPAPLGNSKAEARVHAGNLAGDFVMAMRFFSRLPSGKSPHTRPDLDRIARVLPLASLVIGLVPAVLLEAGVFFGLPPLFAAGLAVGAQVIVTGAMAEDGLADAADGLFGGSTRERRLDILKDSRHGTYGVAALCLFLVLRVLALGYMAGPVALTAGALWLAATVLARSGALWLTLALPPARIEGASAAAGRVSKNAFLTGLAAAMVVVALLCVPVAGPAPLAAAVVLAIGTALGWTAICRRLLGGQTGDLIGALQALIEIGVLTGFLLFV